MVRKSWIWFGLVTLIVLAAAAVTVSPLTRPWPAHGPPGPAWMFPVWIILGLVVGAIALVVGLAAAAVGVAVGLAFGLMGLGIGLVFFGWPLALIALVVWLVLRDRGNRPIPPTAPP